MSILIICPAHWLVSRVFANGPGDLVQSQVASYFYNTLLNTQQYKVRINGKVEQPWESVVAIEKGALWSPSTTVANSVHLKESEI